MTRTLIAVLGSLALIPGAIGARALAQQTPLTNPALNGQGSRGVALVTGRVSQGVVVHVGRLTPGMPGLPHPVERQPVINPGLSTAPNPF